MSRRAKTSANRTHRFQGRNILDQERRVEVTFVPPRNGRTNHQGGVPSSPAGPLAGDASLGLGSRNLRDGLSSVDAGPFAFRGRRTLRCTIRLCLLVFEALRAVDIYLAAKRLRGLVPRTPLRRSDALSTLTGRDVWLKLESQQLTGSFKVRGAFNAIAALPDDVRARGVVASSAGNHGMGVAFAAHHFGIPARIFVPSTAPKVKKQGIARLGAEVDDSEPDYDAAMVAAKAWARTHASTFINPCLGDTLLAGQGTVALEIIEELPQLDTVVVCVGGGGLLGGMGSLLRRVAPHVRIIGVQSVNTAAMARSLAAGRLVEIPSVPTLADGLAGQIDDEALDIGQHALDEMITLEEEEIATAIAWLQEREGLTVEGSGAVGVGALLHGRVREPGDCVAVVVSGSNIDAEKHRAVLEAHGALRI